MNSSTHPDSVFSSLPQLPYDEAYRVLAAFNADPSPDKVSLGAGVYRDDDGKAWTLPSVKEAITRLPDNHDYLPQDGFPPFLKAAQDLVFGDELSSSLQECLTTVQTVSGTGACHVGAVFLINNIKPKNVWISDPSWINHSLIWECAGPEVTRKFYPYYDAKSKSFDFTGMMTTLEAEAQKGDVIILQACAHNPTGLDPTKEQWTKIADLCEKKGIFPFFDTAYQGFATGDPNEDAWSVRHFAQRPALELCVAQSFSKNFGLYGERVGAFHLISRGDDPQKVRPAARSQLVRVVRSTVSCCPSFGCRVVAIVLGDAELRARWLGDLRVMSGRLRAVREGLYGELVGRGTPGGWGHVLGQIGMFSYTGLSAEQVKELEVKYHIYLLSSGRASITGLNTKNLTKVAKAIDSVVRGAA